jgi:hypothetical protein
MKVIVAGSRVIKDKELVYNFINQSPFKITELVSGGAAGVDKIGEQWAQDHNIPIKSFIPHYHDLNPIVAPLLRNTDMAKYADALVAVWKDRSNGTKHMIDQMIKHNKPYVVMELDPQEEIIGEICVYTGD